MQLRAKRRTKGCGIRQRVIQKRIEPTSQNRDVGHPHCTLPGRLLFLFSESYPISSDQFSRYFFTSAMNLPASAPSMMR